MIHFLTSGSDGVDLAVGVLSASGLAGEKHATLASVLQSLGQPRPSALLVAGAALTETDMLAIARAAPHLSVVPLHGADDAAGAVRSLRYGAFDCIVEPFEGEELVSMMRAALAESEAVLRRHIAARETQRKLASLTDRELELVPLICDGLSNKQVAAKLDISIKTVAHHRSQILKKTEAKNTAHMVRLVTIATSIGATRVSGPR